jgi:hypothetical protein
MIMSNTVRATLFSALALAALAGPAQAVGVVVSNLAGPGPASTQTLTVGNWVAQAFNTGASGFTVADWQWDVGQPAGGGMTSLIAIDNAGKPGATVAQSNVVGVPTVQQVFTFFPNNTFSNTLAANTKYWLVLIPNNSGLTYNVQYWNSTPASTGPGTLLEHSGSSNYGANWTNFGSTQTYLVQIDAVTAVPEPSSAAFMALGGALFGVGAWRRARVQAS